MGHYVCNYIIDLKYFKSISCQTGLFLDLK